MNKFKIDHDLHINQCPSFFPKGLFFIFFAKFLLLILSFIAKFNDSNLKLIFESKFNQNGLLFKVLSAVVPTFLPMRNFFGGNTLRQRLSGEEKSDCSENYGFSRKGKSMKSSFLKFS